MFAIGWLAITLASGGYTYVGRTNGGLALWYGGDSILVYASSPQGPFAFRASNAVRDTITMELTRLSTDPVTGYQCTVTVGRWSGSVTLPADSAQRFFTLLHGKPPEPPVTVDSAPRPYFDFQVEKQAGPTPHTAPPVYPEPLRLANISGVVLGQFVIDTMGLAEVLIKGQKVRELVQEPFAFNLRR